MDGARTRQRSFKRKEDADAFAELQRQRERRALGLPSDITFEAYAKAWLRRVLPGIRPRTAESYAWALEHYLIPGLGPILLDRLDRGAIKELLAGLRRAGAGARKGTLAKKSVALVWGTLRTCLASAVDDGLLGRNPAERLGRTLRLAPSRAEVGARVRAFDAGQLRRFLAAAQEKLSRRDALLLRLLASTGLRPGEGAALRWEDLDLEARTALVRSTVDGAGGAGASKTGAERTVDLPAGLTADLEAWAKDAKAAALQNGAPRAPWVFSTAAGAPADLPHLRKRFARALEAAGLAGAFTPHSLRHTYASRMLAAGEPLVYVQDQLGHADVRLTVHLYGRWLRKRAPGAVDRQEAEVSRYPPKDVARGKGGA